MFLCKFNALTFCIIIKSSLCSSHFSTRHCLSIQYINYLMVQLKIIFLFVDIYTVYIKVYLLFVFTFII